MQMNIEDKIKEIVKKHTKAHRNLPDWILKEAKEARKDLIKSIKQLVEEVRKDEREKVNEYSYYEEYLDHAKTMPRTILSINKRRQKNGDVKWSVQHCGSFVVNKDSEAEYEPLPSSRTEAFLKRTRFTFEKALEVAEKYKQKYLSN